jgi:hypothetical protein
MASLAMKTVEEKEAELTKILHAVVLRRSEGDLTSFVPSVWSAGLSGQSGFPGLISFLKTVLLADVVGTDIGVLTKILKEIEVPRGPSNQGVYYFTVGDDDVQSFTSRTKDCKAPYLGRLVDPNNATEMSTMSAALVHVSPWALKHHVLPSNIANKLKEQLEYVLMRPCKPPAVGLPATPNGDLDGDSSIAAPGAPAKKPRIAPEDPNPYSGQTFSQPSLSASTVTKGAEAMRQNPVMTDMMIVASNQFVRTPYGQRLLEANPRDLSPDSRKTRSFLESGCFLAALRDAVSTGQSQTAAAHPVQMTALEPEPAQAGPSTP